jgi:hypothetical protein
MRVVLPSKLEDGRVRSGPFGSNSSYGGYGCFFVQGPCGMRLKIIASGADKDDLTSQGWEHVSVSTERRCPNWIEMCFVKELFWSSEECVVQFHPPSSEYVNNHSYCLHLWRSTVQSFPLPPSGLVGIKSEGVLTPERARQLREREGI